MSGTMDVWTGVPYREDDYGPLTVRWVRMPCPMRMQADAIREQMGGLGQFVVGVTGGNCNADHIVGVAGIGDEWMGVAHGEVGAENLLREEEDADSWHRLVLGFGVPWASLSPQLLIAQMSLVESIPPEIWEEFEEWPIESIGLMHRHRPSDFGVVPRLLSMTMRYRENVGGERGDW